MSVTFVIKKKMQGFKRATMTASPDPIQELRKTVARLRAPDGCPWDRAQTHQSLADCLVEECSELLDTIDREDMDHMLEELGDVLLQVVMHAQLAEEADHFDLDQIAREVNQKLVRRHPHVFGQLKAGSPEEALSRWEGIKATEKKNNDGKGSPLEGLPLRLPALLYARDVFKRMQRNQLSADGHVNAVKLKTLGEQLDEELAGAMLFELAAACRLAKIDPESALRRYTSRLIHKIENAGANK